MTVAEAVDVVAAGIMVLRRRDGVLVTEEQARERARNIVQALDFGGLHPDEVTAEPSKRPPCTIHTYAASSDQVGERCDACGASIAGMAGVCHCGHKVCAKCDHTTMAAAR